MELVTLQTFLTVVEEGGILAASRKLNTVQSNVTTRIRRLEAELGNELFHRQGRGLKLAPAGRVLKEYAEQMLALVQQTQNAVSQVGQQSGELRIGSMESFAAVNLPGALKAVRGQHQGLKLSVETSPSRQLIEKVAHHKLDCAFVGGPVDHPELIAETLLVEELVLAAAIDQDPLQLPLILFREGCTYRNRALTWQQELGHPGVEVMELGTLDGILGCTAVGLGCTLIPLKVAEGSIYADQLSITKLPPHIAQIPTVMIRHKEMPPLDALSTLREAVVQNQPLH